MSDTVELKKNVGVAMVTANARATATATAFETAI